jgi:hypothetical protein
MICRAHLSPEQRAIGRVVAEVAAKQVVLIDEGSGLIEDALDWPHFVVRILTLSLILGVPVAATLA